MPGAAMSSLPMMVTWTEGLIGDATVTTQPMSIATSKPSSSTKKSRVSAARSDLMFGTALLIVTLRLLSDDRPITQRERRGATDRGRTGGSVRRMLHRTLAGTGMHVTPLCLGAMMFGAWGETDHDACVQIIHRALDAGINFIDTADVYSRGESETIVGKALAGGRRDDVVLATKFHGTMGDDVNQAGNSRRWIFREVEASLKRLDTDWIDLYQVHRWDPWTDHDETLGALSDLVAQGKVRYVGSSTYPAAQIVKAQWVARERGLQRFVCEQPPYSILARGIEADVLPTCQEFGMGVIAWSPLGGGWLSGRWRKGAEDLTSRRAAMIPQRYDLSIPANQAKLEAADALGRLADELGVPLVHLALAFVVNHPAVTAAIIGPRTMDQLESQLGAAEVELDGALLDRIDEIVAPGATVNPTDAGWTNPALAPAARRR